MRTVWRSDEPPDPGDYPCDVCGQWPDDCICPECPVCAAQGDEFCYREHALVRSLAQVVLLAEAKRLVAEEARQWDRYAEDWNADQGR